MKDVATNRTIIKKLRVTPDESARYERFVREQSTDFSKVVRDLLDREIERKKGKAAA